MASGGIATVQLRDLARNGGDKAVGVGSRPERIGTVAAMGVVIDGLPDFRDHCRGFFAAGLDTRSTGSLPTHRLSGRPEPGAQGATPADHVVSGIMRRPPFLDRQPRVDRKDTPPTIGAGGIDLDDSGLVSMRGSGARPTLDLSARLQ